ncbi:MAG: nicotinate-nucleotide--dimethylbenzimidazole phosphoribosyltransferase [Bacillota bacterium]|jgi:nicotinate-nucleotide--dimethylbenzimidazole phosphoribosyltransferase
MISQTIKKIKPLDKKAMIGAQKRLDSLSKPKDSLGKLERVLCQLAGIQGKAIPCIKQKAAILAAGDHGVAAQNVSAYPQEVTVQMLLNFTDGGAAMSVLMRQLAGRLYVVDVGVIGDYPEDSGIINYNIRHGTNDISQGAAMTEEEAQKAVLVGIKLAEQAISEGAKIIAIGEMGIANTTPSAALASFYCQMPAAEACGYGTGIDEQRLHNKIAAVEAALKLNQKSAPLAVLAQLGGLEIAALAGIIIGSAAGQCAVVIDGYISSVAALCAVELAPLAKDYIIGSHQSFEPGHGKVLAYLQIEPLLLLDMRLGEGSGAALALQLLDSALLLMTEMTTFSEAGVANKIK